MTQPPEKPDRPFDEVDFALMLATAIVPPHWPFAVLLGVSTVARRSPRIAGYLAGQLGMDRAPAWLLPGAAAQLPAPERGTPKDGDTLATLATPKPVPAAGEGLGAALARLPRRVELGRMRLATSPTAIPLGVDPDGNPVWIDLRTDTYHIGLYGQTGAGKDTLLRAWFIALARRNAPDSVQFAFIDGKGDWLIPQLAELACMFTPPAGGYGKKGDAAILAAVKIIDTEAERRQELIRAAGCTSRDAYVAKTGQPMPLLVVCATDVMTSVAGDVEGLLINLVSKARSLGIRVIVSMQTPTKQDTRWRGNLSTVLAGALQSGSQDEPAMGISPSALRYRPSQLPPPSQRPGVFVCRTAGAQLLVQAPYLSDAAFDQHVAALPVVRRSVPQPPADDDLLASLLAGNELPAHGSEKPARYEPFTACTSEVTELPRNDETTPSGAEIAFVTKLLVTGISRSETAKRIPGYTPKLYKAYKAKVDAVAALLAEGDAPPGKDDDLDTPGGPDLPSAFTF
jgi:hypothetical protein